MICSARERRTELRQLRRRTSARARRGRSRSARCPVTRLAAREARWPALGDRRDTLAEVVGAPQASAALVLARASPAPRRSARSPRIVSRIASTASGPDAAISLANACAAPRRPRRPREAVAQTDRQGFGAPSPGRRCTCSSSARCCPTTAGSVTEMPNPWWNPSLAKLQLNRVSGLATRKSAASASPSPPPTAAPCTAATIGLRSPRRAGRPRA